MKDWPRRSRMTATTKIGIRRMDRHRGDRRQAEDRAVVPARSTVAGTVDDEAGRTRRGCRDPAARSARRRCDCRTVPAGSTLRRRPRRGRRSGRGGAPGRPPHRQMIVTMVSSPLPARPLTRNAATDFPIAASPTVQGARARIQSMFLKDLRHAVRLLLKQPGFTALAVLTLGLGIGANTAIFSVVHAVLLEPMPFPEPERLVQVWESRGRTGLEPRRDEPGQFLGLPRPQSHLRGSHRPS